MLSTFIYWLLSPIILLLVTIIVKDFLAFLKYKKYYKPQGIKLFYKPWIGFLSLILPTNHKNAYHRIEQLLNKTHKDEDLIAFTDADTTDIGLMIVSPEMIKEFFIKEEEHTIRVEMVKVPLYIGIFFERGHHAMMIRGVFNEFFKPENLHKITPMLRNKIELWMGKIKEEHFKDNKDEFKKVDMREVMKRMMSDIVNDVLFGDKDAPKVDGMSLPQADEKLLETLYSGVMKNPLHLMSFGLLHKFNLLSATRESENLAKKMEIACRDSILKREKEAKPEELGCTIRDLLLKHNLNAKEDDVISMKEMIGNSISMIAAGQDTTKNTVELLLYRLSRHPEKIQRIYEELPKIFPEKKDKGAYDSYFTSEYINAIVDENLRIDPVAPFSFTRMVTKNMKLGKYKIYKGTKLFVNYYGNQVKEEYFENGLEFDEKRFIGEENRKKIKKNTFIPFSSGKRACVGKNLAELTMRIMLATFFENFEVRKTDEEEKKTVVRFVKGIEECVLEMRPREFK